MPVLRIPNNGRPEETWRLLRRVSSQAFGTRTRTSSTLPRMQGRRAASEHRMPGHLRGQPSLANSFEGILSAEPEPGGFAAEFEREKICAMPRRTAPTE